MLLLIDDEELLLRTTARYLEQCGFRVQPERDACRALAAFQEAPAQYAAVLLDFEMPGLSGEECLCRILAIRPEIPVLMMTGYPPEELPDSVLTGAHQVLLKPIELPRLAGMLREMFGEAT